MVEDKVDVVVVVVVVGFGVVLVVFEERVCQRSRDEGYTGTTTNAVASRTTSFSDLFHLELDFDFSFDVVVAESCFCVLMIWTLRFLWVGR